jgi:hypothetical protein
MIKRAIPPHWPTEKCTALPPADEVPALLRKVDFKLPKRTEGRLVAHREGHCIIKALGWLAGTHPEFFPATLVRDEAPDFVVKPAIKPASGFEAWSFEHTDAGDEGLQKAFRDAELSRDIYAPSDRQPGLGDGDAADVVFARGVGRAIAKKSNPKSFRNAPDGAFRCVLVYGLSDFAVDPTVARSALASALAAVNMLGGGLDGAMLLFETVRDDVGIHDLTFVPTQE